MKNCKRNRKKIEGMTFLIQILVLIFLAFLFSGLTEAIARGDVRSTLWWMRYNMKFFFLQSYLLFAILLLFYFLFGKISLASTLSGALGAFFGGVEYYFYMFRGDAFSLDQFALSGEAAGVIGKYEIRLTKEIIGTIVILIVLFLILRKCNRRMKASVKVVGTILACAMLFTYYENIDDEIAALGGSEEVYVAKEFYNEFGYLNGLIRIAPKSVEEPEDYNETKIADILNGSTGFLEEQEEYPDIIFIQNESLYYLELLDDMQLSEEPLPYLKELQETYTSGSMISPMVGGGTCNVEYEVLSGYPYANTTVTPFVSLIKSDFVSIVSFLESEGYDTLAMHPNTGSFFNRDNVYNYMGFDKIDFPEDMEEVSEEDSFNGWAGDSYLYKQLIEEYENRDETAPFFAHVVTTQNHGGYDYGYDAYGITTGRTDLTETQRICLETFVNLEKESDESLKELINYFSSVSRPVIIVLWGDHCPSWNDFGIDINETIPEWYLAERSTPLLIWDNYGLPKEDLGYISAYKLGAYALELAGISDKSYFDYLNTQDIPNIIGNLKVNPDGSYQLITELDEATMQKWNDLWLLQYDRMFGKQYSLK